MDNIRMVIVVRKDLNMRKGKLAAQVAHAVTLYYEDYHKLDCEACKSVANGIGFGSVRFAYHKKWIDTGYTKIVVYVDSEKELLDLIEQSKEKCIDSYSVYDFGLTEFHGEKTLTCCGFGPDSKENLDKITGQLKLI